MTRADGGYFGAGLVVRGLLSGAGDLGIDGRFEGTASIVGHLAVGTSGTVVASVRATAVTVAGELRGDVVADGAVAVREGGLVTGDVRAARIAIDDGGALHGEIAMDFALPEAPR